MTNQKLPGVPSATLIPHQLHGVNVFHAIRAHWMFGSIPTGAQAGVVSVPHNGWFGPGPPGSAADGNVVARARINTTIPIANVAIAATKVARIGSKF